MTRNWTGAPAMSEPLHAYPRARIRNGYHAVPLVHVCFTSREGHGTIGLWPASPKLEGIRYDSMRVINDSGVRRFYMTGFAVLSSASDGLLDFCPSC